MYIEEVTIDGFKSYAQRVRVPNFDRYFNAITGLNGTGKSNILDSICFVLGITNLQQVSFQSNISLSARSNLISACLLNLGKCDVPGESQQPARVGV